MNPFVLLLISHVIGDGLIGSPKLARLKRDSRVSFQVLAIAIHTVPHAVFTAVLLFFVDMPWVKGASLVFSLHFLIDIIRCRIELRLFGAGGLNFTKTLAYLLGTKNDSGRPDSKTLKTWALSNIMDQGAHVASLLLITRMILI